MDNSLGFKLRKFFQNKNTVTILGVIVIVIILYLGYNYRINKVTTPYTIPYAKEAIQPKTKITEDMIDYIKVLPDMVTSSVIKNASQLIGKYVNYNTMIPAGSLFYTDAVVDEDTLPDSVLINIPNGYTLFKMEVSVDATYGNIVYPGNYVDLYIKYNNADGNPTAGKILENIKVLAVKDSSGRNVFENTDEDREPSMILFAVPNDIYSLLRRVSYLSTDREIAAELSLVPTNESYKEEPGTLTLKSSEFKNFVELYTADVPEDEFPISYSDNISNEEK